MADHGEVLERFLEPRWDTVVGTLREWLDLEYVRGPRRMGPTGPPDGPGGMGGVSMVLVAAGPGGTIDPSRPPTEVESWKRMWVRRDGRSRVEHRTPGVEAPYLTEIHDAGGMSTVRPDGAVTRSDHPASQSPPTWLLDPGSLLGLLRVRFGVDDEFGGRSVVHAAATMRPELPAMAMSAGPMLYGMPIGGRSELTIDVESGIVVRFATFEGDRLIGLRQFVDLVVDEPVDDDLLTVHLEPGQRFRTHRDDLLDMLRAEGEDVSHIDPDDEQAVQIAMHEFHERRRPLGFGGPRPGRALAELVVPLGPPPGDPDGARAAIEAALTLLADEDGLKAPAVDRGELLDRAREQQQGPPPRHPVLGDQTVTFHLTDHAFIRDDEAVIAFEIRLSGGGRFPFKGRAVRRDSRWLIAYETWAHLQEMGGTSVPSLLDDAGEPEEPDEGA